MDKSQIPHRGTRLPTIRESEPSQSKIRTGHDLQALENLEIEIGYFFNDQLKLKEAMGGSILAVSKVMNLVPLGTAAIELLIAKTFYKTGQALVS